MININKERLARILTGDDRDIFNDDYQVLGEEQPDGTIEIRVGYLPDFLSLTVKLATEGFGAPIVEDRFQGDIALGFRFPTGILVLVPLKRLQKSIVREGQASAANVIATIKTRENWAEALRPLAEAYQSLCWPALAKEMGNQWSPGEFLRDKAT